MAGLFLSSKKLLLDGQTCAVSVAEDTIATDPTKSACHEKPFVNPCDRSMSKSCGIVVQRQNVRE